jgi:hypothetical protein
MKRKGYLLLLLALVGPGCLSSGSHVAKEAKQAVPAQMTFAPPPPPAPPSVTPDQVTEANAPEIVNALNREMDYDATARRSAPPAPMTMPTITSTVSP